MEHERDASAIGVRRRTYDGSAALVVEWDFGVRGGTFGEHEADVFVAACTDAAATRTPLVTLLHSGGTRLQEGMHSLVGIPRAAVALAAVRAAKVPHIAVAAHPTTGGVWVAIGSGADLRLGVRGATVGFSGPRVIEAMTGTAVPPGANTAESATTAGLLDDVVDADDVDSWVSRALRVLRPNARPQRVAAVVAGAQPPRRRGWEQVLHSRVVERPAGRDLAAALLTDAVPLRGGDDSVVAFVGTLKGQAAVIVALASERAGRATPAGYRLLSRAAQLADHLDLAVVTLVDTAGADPLPASEQAGIAAAIAGAMSDLLSCAAPTVAVVHGEGGSGGALAGATCDLVLVTPDSWFAALSPEGAAAALRRSPQEAADLMRVTPGDLVDDGFADAIVPADPTELRDCVARALGRVRAMDPVVRRKQRHQRWSGPLRRAH
jgi:acyl-CoA carboxylase subunit beta